MGTLSIWHWLVVLAVVMILFGRGRISALMSDVGKGIGSLRRELGRTDEQLVQIDGRAPHAPGRVEKSGPP